MPIRGRSPAWTGRLHGEFVGHVRALFKRSPTDQDVYVGHSRDDFTVLDDQGREKGRGSGMRTGIRGPVVVELGGPGTLSPTDPGLIHSGTCHGSYAPDLFRDYRPEFPRIR